MKTEIFLHRALDMISENQKLICSGFAKATPGGPSG